MLKQGHVAGDDDLVVAVSMLQVKVSVMQQLTTSGNTFLVAVPCQKLDIGLFSFVMIMVMINLILLFVVGVVFCYCDMS